LRLYVCVQVDMFALGVVLVEPVERERILCLCVLCVCVQVDMFALGVVLVELLCPFATMSERAHVLTALRAAVAAAPPPPRPHHDPPRSPRSPRAGGGGGVGGADDEWVPGGLPGEVAAAAARYPEDARLALRLLAPCARDRPSATEVWERVGRWLGSREATELLRLRQEVDLIIYIYIYIMYVYI
jgi:hypothetical protein